MDRGGLESGRVTGKGVRWTGDGRRVEGRPARGRSGEGGRERTGDRQGVEVDWGDIAFEDKHAFPNDG